MQTVQVVLDADLLQEADLAARKHNINRSALIRDALRGHLKRMHILDLEQEERLAYQRIPASREDALALVEIASWAGEEGSQISSSQRQPHTVD